MLIVLWLLKSLMYIMHLKITKKSNRKNHLTDLRTKNVNKFGDFHWEYRLWHGKLWDSRGYDQLNSKYWQFLIEYNEITENIKIIMENKKPRFWTETLKYFKVNHKSWSWHLFILSRDCFIVWLFISNRFAHNLWADWADKTATKFPYVSQFFWRFCQSWSKSCHAKSYGMLMGICWALRARYRFISNHLVCLCLLNIAH